MRKLFEILKKCKDLIIIQILGLILLIIAFNNWLTNTIGGVIFGAAIILFCYFIIKFILQLFYKYTKILNKFTILAITYYSVGMIIFLLIIKYILSLRYKFNESYLFPIFLYAACCWTVYLTFCIKVLKSINIACSLFVATTAKAILIAIVAWMAVYNNSKSSLYINYVSIGISFSYPILDMYIYVRSEINKYI